MAIALEAIGVALHLNRRLRSEAIHDKDGRATVFWQYQGDQQTEDEFWSTSA
jgi:hypothetical protein